MLCKLIITYYYVLNKNKLKKVNPFHKECINIEEANLPDNNLVAPSPIPRTNSGGNSLRLKCANAKINAEERIPIAIPNSLAKTGNKTPLNTISSKNGARIVVVMNNNKNAK